MKKFCHDINCPYFTTVANYTEFEVREYAAQYWISTTLGEGLQRSQEQGFYRLFNYISGSNKQKQSVDMTAPVLNSASSTSVVSGNFTISFYFPYIYQNPSSLTKPDPSSADTFIQLIPARRVAVYSFSGFENNSNVNQFLLKLQGLLKEKSIKFDESKFVLAGYDPPFRLFNVCFLPIFFFFIHIFSSTFHFWTQRHNEIWVDLI